MQGHSRKYDFGKKTTVEAMGKMDKSVHLTTLPGGGSPRKGGKGGRKGGNKGSKGGMKY